MSRRRGRYPKFDSDFEPEPWYTDGEDDTFLMEIDNPGVQRNSTNESNSEPNSITDQGADVRGADVGGAGVPDDDSPREERHDDSLNSRSNIASPENGNSSSIFVSDAGRSSADTYNADDEADTDPEQLHPGHGYFEGEDSELQGDDDAIEDNSELQGDDDDAFEEASELPDDDDAIEDNSELQGDDDDLELPGGDAFEEDDFEPPGHDDFEEDPEPEAYNDAEPQDGMLQDEVIPNGDGDAHEDDPENFDENEAEESGMEDEMEDIINADDYETIYKHLSKEWLEVEINHRVSKVATNAFWDLAMEWFHRMFVAKKEQNVRKKTPKFPHIRRLLHKDYVPPIKMSFGYKDKESGDMTIVEDSLITPKGRFPANQFDKMYEISHVEVMNTNVFLSFKCPLCLFSIENMKYTESK